VRPSLPHELEALLLRGQRLPFVQGHEGEGARVVFGEDEGGGDRYIVMLCQSMSRGEEVKVRTGCQGGHARPRR